MAATVKASAYAFFWPGLLVLPAVIVENYTFREADGDGAVPLLIAIIWHVLIGLWGWIRMIIAVRILHDLSFWKAVIVAIWLPVLLVVLVLIGALVFAL